MSLDSSWKDEQVKFIEKQQARQGGGSSAAGSSKASARQPSKVKHPWPFSRDPANFFRASDGTVKTFPAPMNHNAHSHTGIQPVKYSKVTLMRDLGGFKTNTTFEVAQVNWFTGLIKLFASENDALMGNAAFEDVVFNKATTKYANMFYIREILEYLQRGHSLLEPNCQCIHKCGEERAKELGITLPKARKSITDPFSTRDGECKLPRARTARTAVELAHELAVGDLYAVEDIKGGRLVDDIAKNPKILVTEQEGGGQLFAFKATFDAVSSKQELLQLVNISPLGLKEPTEKDTYNGVQQDVAALFEEGAIYKITNPDGKTSVLFPRLKSHECKVDSDIRQLWAESGYKGRIDADDIDRELLKVGLQPTRQAKPEKRVLGKRKGPGTGKRRKKKQNNLGHLVLPSGRQ
mmetsp:Transcript_13423/g.32375  ORF Transcript_13423/g.32375 Transcript_13423/m.32375 type:complete len:408 (+) Transcript_13423:201-1424(+)